MSVSTNDLALAAGITLAAFTARVAKWDPFWDRADPVDRHGSYVDLLNEEQLIRLIADRRGPAFRRVVNERYAARAIELGLTEDVILATLPYCSKSTKDTHHVEVAEEIPAQRPVAPRAGPDDVPLEQPPRSAEAAPTVAA